MVTTESRRPDALALAAIVACHLGLVLGYLQWPEFLCFSDCVVDTMPRFVAATREVQAGAMPLLDLHTYAGAKPWWSGSPGLYYPFLLPLYWLVDTASTVDTARLLIVLPHVVHLGWASLGTYLFLRCCTGVTPLAAAVGAFAYGLSAPLTNIELAGQVQSMSYLPWVMIAVDAVMLRGSAAAFLGGALGLGLLNVAGLPDDAIRIWFVVGLQAALVGGLSLRQAAAGGRPAFTAFVRRLAAVAAMGGFGIGLAGFVLAGIARTISWDVEGMNLSCANVAQFAPESSLRPAALLHQLLPSAASDLMLRGTAPTGGILHGVLMLLGVFGAARSSASPAWCGTARISLATGLLVILGSNTPVFGVLCTVLPPFFGFPHPIDYSFAVTWAAALLVAVGVDAARTVAPGRLVAVLAAVAAAAAGLLRLTDAAMPFAWRFDPQQLLAFVGAVTGLGIAAAWLPQRARVIALAVLAVGEYLITPAHLAIAPPSVPRGVAFHSGWNLSPDPFTELRPILVELGARGERYAGVASYVDNQAWITGTRALFGHSAQAIEPAFRDVLGRFTVGAPYQLWMQNLPQFLGNMGVGHVVLRKGMEADVRRFDVLRDLLPRVKEELAAFPLVRETRDFAIYALQAPLPMVYAQDRVVLADAEEATAAILHDDVRGAARVDPADVAQLPPLAAAATRAGAATADEFAALQRENIVLRDTRPDSTRRILDVRFSRPALLVLNEAWIADWHATVDGAHSSLLRVNRVQTGVWLEAGVHTVELNWAPWLERAGRFASAGFFAVWLTGVGAVVLGRRRQRRSGRHGESPGHPGPAVTGGDGEPRRRNGMARGA